MDNYDTLVLPGGGMKGFTLLGALQAAIDNSLMSRITTYVGTSVGAMIGYLLAIGYTPIEIMVAIHVNKWLEHTHQFNLNTMINGNGATSFNSLHEGLEKLTINKIGKLINLGTLLKDYGKKLVCVTYNMTSCRTEYLSADNHPDLPCITALRMSANIPLVFERFKYMDNFYIDGAITDNFPILEGINRGKKVLGIFIDVLEESLRDEPADGIITYILRLLQIPRVCTSKYRVEQAQGKCMIIPLEATDFHYIFEFDIKSKTRLEMFSSGYSQVKEFLEKKSTE
jgi:predicted acylesterase/phospholipase RssA